jgi:hypothetical protein
LNSDTYKLGVTVFFQHLSDFYPRPSEFFVSELTGGGCQAKEAGYGGKKAINGNRFK